MSGFGPFIDGIGVLLVDRELRVIDADAAMAALSGRPAVEQAGRLVRELYPLLAPALEAMLQGVLATGEPARDCELRGELRADEPVRWLVSFEPVRTRSGAVLAVECFVRALASDAPDSTLSITQAALYAATAQLAFQARILELLNDAVVAVDSRGAISYWGPAAEQLFGATAGEVAGRSVLEVLRPQLPQPAAIDHVRALLLAGDVWRGEVLLRTAADTVVHAEVSARATGASDTNYLMVIRDITERRRAEHAAEEGRQLFQLIAEASPDLIYIYDKMLDRNVYANAGVTTILGYSAAQVQALGPALLPTLAHPDDLAAMLAFNARVCQAQPGEVLELEYRMRHADGDYRWLYGREVLLSRDPEGRPHLMLGVAQDVTARKLAELERAALRASEQEVLRRSDEARALLDTLIGSAPIGFDFVDRDLRFVLVNDALAANNGLPAAAHLGRTVREVLPQLADVVEPMLRQVLDSGEPLLDIEVRGETPGQPGVERIWRESLYPVRGSDGLVIGVGAIVTEITEHRRSSEERAQLQALARAAAGRIAHLQTITAALAPAYAPAEMAQVIVEQALTTLGARSSVVLLLDAGGEYLEVMHAIGYGPELAPGRRRALAANEPLSDALRSGAPIFVRNLAEAEALYPQLRAARAAGVDVAWANLPLISEGRVQGALSLGFDTPQPFTPDDQAMLAALAQQCAQALERSRLHAAEREAREDAERAVRDRDELTALISHDLKNPLTVIQGQAQLLERRLSRGEEVERARLIRGLGAIHQAAAQMSAQIEELLDVAMIRAGRPLRLDLQQADLVEIVQRAISLAQTSTELHTLRLIVDGAAFTGEWDGPRIERVVTNLLSNAIKYSPDGGPVEVTLRHEPDGAASISVADAGIGIPARDLPHIFERFHRAANSAGRIKGTGLGLTSALRIIEQQGGTIEVTSVEGQGSVFTVRLPL